MKEPVAITIQIWKKPIETELTSLSDAEDTKWGIYITVNITFVRERDKKYCRSALPEFCGGLYYDRQKKKI